ncbi:MAG: NUDIX domain-containing protein [Candidatus Aenigmatarchaeota archaeon]
MKRERSAGAVIFRKEGEELLFLLLHYQYKSDYWGFSMGHIEKGEEPKKTVLREVKEETGIDNIIFVDEFKEKVKWFYRRDGETFNKEVIFYLAETNTKEIILSEEHVGYQWLTFEIAQRALGFENTKNVLENANSFLKERGNSNLEKFMK